MNEFSAIILSENYEGKHNELLAALDLERNETGGKISISVASENKDCTSIGCFNDATLVFDFFLPYDSSHNPYELNDLDQRLLMLSKNSLVLCFYFQGTGGTYGFSIFKDNKRIRCYLRVLGDLIANSGNLLLSETEFQRDNQQEQRIFALTEEVLGKRLDEIIDEGTLMMKLYC